jgi:hypothetical protein
MNREETKKTIENALFSTRYYDDHIKEDERGNVRSMHASDKKRVHNFDWII